jgi:hypothetical protein
MGFCFATNPSYLSAAFLSMAFLRRIDFVFEELLLVGFMRLGESPPVWMFLFVLVGEAKNKKMMGPLGRRRAAWVLLPDFPQGMGGIGAALNDAQFATSPARECSPHPGIKITALNDASGDGSCGPRALECCRNIAVTTCETSHLQRQSPDGHL